MNDLVDEMLTEFKELQIYTSMVDQLERAESAEKFFVGIIFPKLELHEEHGDLFNDKRCDKCPFELKEDFEILDEPEKKR